MPDKLEQEMLKRQSEQKGKDAIGRIQDYAKSQQAQKVSKTLQMAADITEQPTTPSFLERLFGSKKQRTPDINLPYEGKK